MKSFYLLALSVSVSLVAVHCKSTSSAKKPLPNTPQATAMPDSLSDLLFARKWLFTELNGTPLPLVAESKTPHLLFYSGEKNKLSGFTGCSPLFGSFKLIGKGAIKFLPSSLKSTCSNTIDQKLLLALQKCTGYHATENDLVLYNGAAPIARLKAQDTRNFWSGEWEVDFVSVKTSANERLYPGRKPRVSFRYKTGEASGNTSCNSFRSRFSTEGKSIFFNPPVVMTRMACEGKGEMAFLQLLQKANNFEFITNDTLSLKLDEVMLLRLVKK